MIAPYWADVDTGDGGEVFYRQSTDPGLLASVSRDIQTTLSLTETIEIKNLLIATWSSVGYFFNRTDKVRM